MRNFLFALVLIFISVENQAQNPIPSGTKYVNMGVGFSNHGVPIYGGMDFGIGHNISLGFNVSHRFDYDFADWGIAGTFNYHFNQIMNIPNNWDFYAGFNIGSVFGNNTTDLDLGGQIGFRYFFNQKIGINLQFGGGNNFSDGTIGLTFKL